MSSDITKTCLAQALISLMEARPFDKISVNLLAHTAHVSRNTFYYYFADKYELVEWTFQHHIEQAASRCGHNGEWRNMDIFEAVSGHQLYYTRLINSSAATVITRKISALVGENYRRIFSQYLGQRHISEDAQEIIMSFISSATAGCLTITIERGFPVFDEYSIDISRFDVDCMKYMIDTYSSQAPAV